VLIDKGLDVAAQGRHEPEVVEDHRAQLEDEATQLLQSLVHHHPQARELLPRALRVDLVEALADLRLQDDVGHRLRGTVVHLARDAAALLLLRVDDRLEELRLVEALGGRRRGRGRWGGGRVAELRLRALDERQHAVEELALRVQRRELTLHRHAPALGGDVLVGSGDELLPSGGLRGVVTGLCLILTLLEAGDLGLRRVPEHLELFDLSAEVCGLAREARCHAQWPISGALIQPWRIA